MRGFLVRLWFDERGAALPLAIVTLALLSSLILGLSVMSATEPTIAANQLRTAQARALAEAGIERALWALANPEAPDGLRDPFPATVPPPYDGSRLIVVTTRGEPLGGFRLSVLAGAARNEREVVSVGWAPTDATADTRPKSHRRITGTLWRLRVPAESAPCALCVRGDLEVTDEVTVDARADARCGGKRGAWSSGVVSVAPSAKVWGADGNDTPNEDGDYVQAQPADAALAWNFTDADLLALKRLARARGSYYRGSVLFDALRPAPQGLVFVDTANGAPITDTTPAADLGRAELRGGAFRGWLVVAGSIEISGDARVRGLVYAQDGFAYRGATPGGIEGQVVAAGVRGGSGSLSRTGVGPALTFDCTAASGGDGTVPRGWMLKAGSYREPPDP
ncbi:MAG TPA: hypothetical protein VJA45_14745 [Methylomirabilota bacterium]|nr:hypothetical protein [Methylomirabilota bacterium]